MVRILIAEDDQYTREMVQRALVADGHDVVTANDGSAALEQIEKGGAFDLVMTDVEMPNMSGLALAEKLLEADPGQRIIIMSGLADELSSARALLRSTVRMLTKPVTLERIRGEVNELLG